MSHFYSDGHRSLQDAHGTRRLADAVHDNILRTSLTGIDRKFITRSDFFFLSTLDHRGYPSVSYKGGAPGFVRISDDRSLAFPIYDGNGMFYSAGNVADTSRVGLLFIDLETPRRLRLHGDARISDDPALTGSYHEARLVIEVAIRDIFTNCPRYIHRHKRLESSPNVPQPDRETPVPEWKRVDYLQDALPEADREKARASGKRITEAEYRRNFWSDL